MSQSLSNPLLDDESDDDSQLSSLRSVDSLASRQSNNVDHVPIDVNSTNAHHSTSKYDLFKANLRPLIHQSTPVILTYILQYSMNVIGLMFVGRLGADKLAAASLALTACNITGYSVLFGFATAVDTLSSQSLGSGSFHEVGRVVQRTAAVVLAISCLTGLVWFFMADLLIFLGQDRAVSIMAGQFVWIMAGSVLASAWFEVVRKYLICLKKVRSLVIILACANVLLVCLLYLLIHGLDLGFVGGPWAMVITNWSLLGATVALCKWKGWHKETWPAPSLHEAFREWRPIIILGAGGAGMLTAKYGCLFIITLMAGWLGKFELATFGVISQLQTILVMIPYGIGATIAAMVGSRLGAGEPHEAKWTALTAFGAALALQSVLILILCVSIGTVATLFTSDARVLDLVQTAAPLVALLFLVDTVQAVTGGVLRGLGMQKIAAVTSVIAYYFIGIPIAILLTRSLFLGVYGLVLGVLAGIAVTALVFFLTVMTTKWEKESERVRLLHVSPPLRRKMSADQLMDAVDASPVATLFRLPVTVEMEQLTNPNIEISQNRSDHFSQ